MIKSVCGEKDCPLHPEYLNLDSDSENIKYIDYHEDLIKISRNWETSDNYSGQADTFNLKSIPFVENEKKFEFKTEHINCNIECLFCIHKKKFNMKNEIIVATAKKLLEE